MSKFAESTKVSSVNTKTEIERTLIRYGADGFAYAWDGPRAIVAFRLRGRHIRFTLPLPDRSEFALTPERGWERTPAQVDTFYEQAVRQRWRALLLIIKAKLEAVDAGIVELEDEFLANTVLPNNETAGAWLRPQLQIAYERGDMPRLLPGPAR